jgi:SAM-dependent methyltransferase
MISARRAVATDIDPALSGGMNENDAFGAVAPHYDLLMSGVPYPEWVRHLRRIFDYRGCAPRRILDLCCGTGIVSMMLAALGYEVVGIDISAPMIREARAKRPRRGAMPEFYVQDASRLCIPPPPFDACVCLFDSLNYITDPAALTSAMRGVYDHLAPGGLFVFDINTVYALEEGFFDQSNRGYGEPLEYDWRSTYNRRTRLCHVEMDFVRTLPDGGSEAFHETHVQFAYSEPELRAMLAGVGFSSVESFHAYTMLPVQATTDRAFYVASRPGAD